MMSWQPRCRDFFRRFDEWRETAQRRPLEELIWRIYQQSGYLAFCSGLPGGDQRVANLLYLHERAAQFGTFQRQGLSRFMRFIESLRDEADLGTPSIASEADDVVRLMSIHRAKGLEFPVVILADLGKAINLQDCQGTILVDRSAGLGLEVVDEAGVRALSVADFHTGSSTLAPTIAGRGTARALRGDDQGSGAPHLRRLMWREVRVHVAKSLAIAPRGVSGRRNPRSTLHARPDWPGAAAGRVWEIQFSRSKRIRPKKSQPGDH